MKKRIFFCNVLIMMAMMLTMDGQTADIALRTWAEEALHQSEHRKTILNQMGVSTDE